MDEIIITIFNYIVSYIDAVFAEASIILLIFGVLLFLIGTALVVSIIHVLMTGHRVNGTVIGAIKNVRVKEKTRDGKIERERKETLYAIYEYIDSNGVTRQERSSNGGSGILRYKTGQGVKLIVCPAKEYNDIYDSEDASSLIAGSIFIAIGVGLIFLATDIFASLNITILTLLGIIVSMVFRGKNKNKSTKKKTTDSILPNRFDRNKMRPIEEAEKS